MTVATRTPAPRRTRPTAPVPSPLAATEAGAPVTTAEGLVVFDAARRTYLGLSHDGSYWHAIAPARADDWLVRNLVVSEGTLTCSCASGRVRGWCYRVEHAIAYENQQSWFGEPAPAEVIG